MCPPNPMEGYEHVYQILSCSVNVYQILSCGMNVSTKSCDVECDSCWAGTGPVSVNMPDPIWKRFGYGQLWSLQPMCSQNQARSNMPDPDFLHPFQFCFSKDGMDDVAQNQPGSHLDGLVRCIWSGSKVVCRNHWS